MKALRCVKKWLCSLWDSGVNLSTARNCGNASAGRIDSHKWESKIEIWQCLSHRCH